MKTLYEVLGVCPDAGDEALKAAYRRLAKIHHPDLNPGDPEAALRFRQITVAIRVLRDAKRRAAYDRRLARDRRRWFDHEREHRRLRQSRLIVTGVIAAAMMSLVLVIESRLVGSVRPMPGVMGGRADLVQAPAGAATKPPENISRENFNAARRAPELDPDLRIALDRREEELARPELHCQQETGSRQPSQVAGSLTAAYNIAPFEMAPGCEPQHDHEADEEISANQRAALIRQAQELLATGDPKSARVMSQRACRNKRAPCGRRESL